MSDFRDENCEFCKKICGRPETFYFNFYCPNVTNISSSVEKWMKQNVTSPIKLTKLEELFDNPNRASITNVFILNTEMGYSSEKNEKFYITRHPLGIETTDV